MEDGKGGTVRCYFGMYEKSTVLREQRLPCSIGCIGGGFSKSTVVLEQLVSSLDYGSFMSALRVPWVWQGRCLG